MCLGLKSLDDKSKEIPAVQQMISVLHLEGAVTAGDMRCQRDTVQAMVEKDADYLLIVKGDQPTLQIAIMKGFRSQTQRYNSQREVRVQPRP